jgi:hypothetical protein
MTAIYVVRVLLWLVLAALLSVLVVLVFFPGNELTMTERLASGVVTLLLAAPIGNQLRVLNQNIREMTANQISLGTAGVDLRLNGSYREAKGLVTVSQTHLAWNEIDSVSRDRRTFMHRSLIPFSYSLDVFTIHAGAASFSFTNECISGAKQIAQDIAARIGRTISAK